MAYKCMKKLISIGKRSKTELADKADVYYAAGRLTDEQYAEVIALIDAM